MSGARYDQAAIERIKAEADLAAIVGARVALKKQGDEYVGCCPFHAEKTPSFYVIPKKRMWHCFAGCGSGDVIRFLMKIDNLSFIEALKQLDSGADLLKGHVVPASVGIQRRIDDEEDKRKRIEKAVAQWNEAIPADGTLVENYLASRGIVGVPVPPVLRFHPRCWNAEKHVTMPAMIAAVTAQNKIVGIHRTFLRPDGHGKADIRTAKMMLGACAGGHVMLRGERPVRLAVAEGIETAMTIMMAMPDLAVWAALSLGNMRAPVPPSVRELILCADGDNKDQCDADKRLNRAAQAHMTPGRSIRIARPKAGMDFNDMVRP